MNISTFFFFLTTFVLSWEMPGKFCGLNMHHLQREEGMSHSSLQQLERIFAHKFQEVAFACLQVIIHRKAQLSLRWLFIPAPRKIKVAHYFCTPLLYYCHLEKEQLAICLRYWSVKSDFGQGIHFHRDTCISTELNFWGTDLQRQSCLQHFLHTVSYLLQILLTNHRLSGIQSTGNPSI